MIDGAATRAWKYAHRVSSDEAESRCHHTHRRSAQEKSISRSVFMVIVALEWCDSSPGSDTELGCLSPDVGILVSEYCDRFLQFPPHTSVGGVLN